MMKKMRQKWLTYYHTFAHEPDLSVRHHHRSDLSELQILENLYFSVHCIFTVYVVPFHDIKSL